MEKIIQKIRHYINKPRRQYNLIKNKPYWYQLCSSLDVIEDAELAINSFTKYKTEKDEGTLYLLIYGVLQALFIQQDAVFNLCEALGIEENIKSYQELTAIRDIRNESVGHPTKKKEKEGKSYNFISRITMGIEGFQLVKNYSDGKLETKDISLTTCIEEQRKYLNNILDSVIITLQKEERKHKEKYMREKVEKCFPETLHYHITKIYESLNKTNPSEIVIGKISLKTIKETLLKFKNTLEKRGIFIDAYDGIKWEYKWTEYPLKVLMRHMECIKQGKKSKINKEDARIFTESLEKHIKELKVMAKEIDDEYVRVDE